MARCMFRRKRRHFGLPGFRLHPLKGEHQGRWSITVNGNWRMVFAFEGVHAVLVDCLDYH